MCRLAEATPSPAQNITVYGRETMALAIPFGIDTGKRHPYDTSSISVCSEIGVLGTVSPEISRGNEVCRNQGSEIRFVRK